MNLIVVESPTKARTLSRFLGSDYKIEASMGHIRDLPDKKLGIDVEHDFEPTYVQTAKQKERTETLKRLSAQAQKIYLATDPDREGEAIAWHIAALLNAQKKIHRVTFHEITKGAIENALNHPGEIDERLVDAQQARRFLDRLVGYKLSPLLWKKVRKGLSAGRVQSVAVRLIVEREREIEAFKPKEYWEIEVWLKGAEIQRFKVKLYEEIKTQAEAEKIEKDLLYTRYRVLSIDKKGFKRTPPAPYTTSTLQQAAANRMGWSAKKTMQTAQRLYEMGFITYHRTDSTNLALEALKSLKTYIADVYGANYTLETPRFYKTKSKVAQEAHEAIRPTNLHEVLLQNNRDEQKLYELIWKRFVACQMAEVTGTSVTVIVVAGNHKLKAKGENILFDGWYKVLDKDSEENILPEVKESEELDFVSLEKMQKFTQGPARYNDASLIKTLEELGIGRPSTYAPIITTIVDRQYVEKNTDKRYQSTALGIGVNDFLVKNFADVMDYKFTAGVEDELDDIAKGDKQWQKVLAAFWQPFSSKITAVQDTAERVKIEVETTGEKCPKCKDGDVVVRVGKFGKFLACSTYPTCDYKANFQNKTGQKCEKCKEGDVIIRKTRSGRSFYGCSNYPKCDFASWNKPAVKT